MRIVCPSCQAAYEVPDTLLSGGKRRVRCARCGGDWTPEPEPAPAHALLPAPDPAPPAEPAHEPAPATAATEPDLPPPPPVHLAPAPEPIPQDLPPPPAGRKLTVLAAAGWAASLALLAAAGWAGVAYRDDVMAAWGASRRLYALLGLG